MTAPAIDDLVRRLEHGWQTIDTERDPIRRRRLEDRWLILLRQYQLACDQLATAYVAQTLELTG